MKYVIMLNFLIQGFYKQSRVPLFKGLVHTSKLIGNHVESQGVGTQVGVGLNGCRLILGGYNRGGNSHELLTWAKPFKIVNCIFLVFIDILLEVGFFAMPHINRWVVVVRRGDHVVLSRYPLALFDSLLCAYL
jgi:hypothetical protein